jgi:hypothetical protein
MDFSRDGTKHIHVSLKKILKRIKAATSPIPTYSNVASTTPADEVDHGHLRGVFAMLLKENFAYECVLR